MSATPETPSKEAMAAAEEIAYSINEGLIGAGFVGFDINGVRALAFGIQRHFAALRARVAELHETNCILQSQVDNADANWQQQKLCTDSVRAQLQAAQANEQALREALNLVKLACYDADSIEPEKRGYLSCWIVENIVQPVLASNAGGKAKP